MLREVALRIVWAMLAECAPDHVVEEKLHHYWVITVYEPKLPKWITPTQRRHSR